MERLLAVIKAMEKNLDLHLEKIIAKLDAHWKEKMAMREAQLEKMQSCRERKEPNPEQQHR
jgi:hypothetical protein